MTVILTRKPIKLSEAVTAIKAYRPDFKIGAMFLYKGLWHAIYDGGTDSVSLICIKVDNNKKVHGVNPFDKNIIRTDFFNALNNKAYDENGHPLKTQKEREMEIAQLPSSNGKRVFIKDIFK